MASMDIDKDNITAVFERFCGDFAELEQTAKARLPKLTKAQDNLEQREQALEQEKQTIKRERASLDRGRKFVDSQYQEAQRLWRKARDEQVILAEREKQMYQKKKDLDSLTQQQTRQPSLVFLESVYNPRRQRPVSFTAVGYRLALSSFDNQPLSPSLEIGPSSRPHQFVAARRVSSSCMSSAGDSPMQVQKDEVDPLHGDSKEDAFADQIEDDPGAVRKRSRSIWRVSKTDNLRR